VRGLGVKKGSSASFPPLPSMVSSSLVPSDRGTSNGRLHAALSVLCDSPLVDWKSVLPFPLVKSLKIELNLTTLELGGNLTPRHVPNQHVTTCSAGLKRKHRVQGPLLTNSWLNLNKGVKNGC